MNWQDISTAPRDGTLILLASDGSMPVVPGFCVEKDIWCYWDGDTTWFEAMWEDAAVLYIFNPPPKYWMHLPEPPKE